MKKIGILTFHRASNYGAVLQAYALQTAFEQLGYTAEIIDYRCPAVENDHHPGYFLKNRGIRSIHRLPGKISKYRLFEKFRSQYLHLSKKAGPSDVSAIEADYSVLVAGSDQLWSEKFSGSDPQFFFPLQSDKRKYTYAVSIGDSSEQKTLQDMLKKYGNSFQTISLREESSIPFVSSCLQTTCRADLDPVFLLQTDYWKHFSKIPDINEPYILIYTVAQPVKLIEKAAEISLMTGWKIIYLNSSYSNIAKHIHRVRYSSPEEFVGWFANADFIFTNSFHGTAFSIIMNRPFAIEDHSNRGKNIRSLDLIAKINLKDRNITNDQFFNTGKNIDWEQTNRILKQLRNNSLSYLREIAE